MPFRVAWRIQTRRLQVERKSRLRRAEERRLADRAMTADPDLAVVFD